MHRNKVYYSCKTTTLSNKSIVALKKQQFLSTKFIKTFQFSFIFLGFWFHSCVTAANIFVTDRNIDFPEAIGVINQYFVGDNDKFLREMSANCCAINAGSR